ncbi:hypothetical protein BCF74_11934 [Knoellia remsis]|uniref:Uncharacterized protein n=1 Tax=Knoellia remsis TaxID=407159 RepID=A0A2T0UES3_9MICO|nr:hypothetical protein [Knoellia remsis]PRY56317.1 hypothetical protein BCF74_11934 [Knoellia remsis]
MTQRIRAAVRGHEVVAGLLVAVALGLILLAVPRVERLVLLVGAASVLVLAVLLIERFVHGEPELTWTTSSGTPARVRGHDRRITALTRAIEASRRGDLVARATVQDTLRSLARDRTDLGPDLTAYLNATNPPDVDAARLDAHLTELEEH